MTLRARRAANLTLVRDYFESKERERRREELASLTHAEIVELADRIILEAERELGTFNRRSS